MNRPLTVLSIVALVGFLYFAFIRHRPHPEAARPPVKNDNSQLDNSHTSSSPGDGGFSFLPGRANNISERLAGNVLLIPQQSPEKLSFRFKVFAESCGPADVEMIRNSLKNTKSKDLVLELKSLANNQASAVRLSMEELTGSALVQISTKPFSAHKRSAQVFSLSLCHDSGDKLSCGAKDVFQHKGFRQLASKDFSNKVFYRQILVRDHYGFQILPMHAWDKKSFNANLALFGKADTSSSNLERLRSSVDQISPIPATLSGSHVLISLLSSDPKCK